MTMTRASRAIRRICPQDSVLEQRQRRHTQGMSERQQQHRCDSRSAAHDHCALRPRETGHAVASDQPEQPPKHRSRDDRGDDRTCHGPCLLRTGWNDRIVASHKPTLVVVAVPPAGSSVSDDLHADELIRSPFTRTQPPANRQRGQAGVLPRSGTTKNESVSLADPSGIGVAPRTFVHGPGRSRLVPVNMQMHPMW